MAESFDDLWGRVSKKVADGSASKASRFGDVGGRRGVCEPVFNPPKRVELAPEIRDACRELGRRSHLPPRTTIGRMAMTAEFPMEYSRSMLERALVELRGMASLSPTAEALIRAMLETA